MDDHPGDDLVGLACEFLEHPKRVFHVRRFSEKPAVSPYDGVGGEDDVIR